METADQPNTPLTSAQVEELEDQGLRILATIIARKLAKSRRSKVVGAYEQGADDASASGYNE